IPVPKYRENVSPDGSHVFFMSAGQLYARVDHERTVWVSEPQTGEANPPAPSGVRLEDVVGADGRHVIFSTTSQLLPEDTNEGRDIYMYSEGSDHEHDLTLLTNTGVVQAGAAVGASDDAHRVYYFSGSTFHLWEDGVTRTVGEGFIVEERFGRGFAATESAPSLARVSTDGEYLAFQAQAGGGQSDQVYLYSATEGHLACVSCSPHGPTSSAASIMPELTTVQPASSMHLSRPSFLTSHGKVFF